MITAPVTLSSSTPGAPDYAPDLILTTLSDPLYLTDYRLRVNGMVTNNDQGVPERVTT